MQHDFRSHFLKQQVFLISKNEYWLRLPEKSISMFISCLTCFATAIKTIFRPYRLVSHTCSAWTTHSLPPHIYDAWSNKIRLATHILGSILIQLNNKIQNIRLFYRPDLFTTVYRDDCH